MKPRSICCLFVLSFGAITLAACEDDASSPEPSPDAGTSSFDAGEPDASQTVDAGPTGCPPPTHGPTTHDREPEADEVWTADTSPHIVTVDLPVRDGRKLTIEPCAEVRVAKGKHLFVAYPGTPNVGGRLIAEGTAERPIAIRGQTSDPWASLYVHAPGTARLAWVTLEGGGGGDFEDNATIDVLGDGVAPADPLLFVDHVTIRKSVGTGLWMQRGSTFSPGSRDLTVTASGNSESPFPVQLEASAIDAFPTGTFTGNAVDEILLRTGASTAAGSGLVADATLRDRGVPYRVGKTKGEVFVIAPGEGLPPATLTIEAGVKLRFQKEGGLDVQTFTTDKPATAGLRALGTADKPIVFTSAQETPAAGDWRGIWFGGRPMATNALDHVIVEHAGSDCSCSLNTCSATTGSDGAVILTGQPSSAFITNSVFRHIAGNAITQGYDGTFVDFRPTNTFEDFSGCRQTLPRDVGSSCPTPKPICDEP